MNDLQWESWGAIIAFLISAAFIIHPGPYLMGAFTFIAQPLFVIVMVSYGIKVLRELRRRKVL